MTQEILKYVLEQASGVVIALMLIMRIETKLDSLTSAIIRNLKVQNKHTTDFYICAIGDF